MMQRCARWAIALLLGSAAAGGIASGQAPANEAQVKAAFVYNFLKFVEWPAGAFTGPRDSLVIGIVGTSATVDAAAGFLHGKQVNDRAIAIRRLDHDDAVTGVHAVFVGDADRARAQRILDATAAAAILSIGETNGFATQGGVINLFVEHQKVRFEINTGAAEHAGLRISSKLLALARLVEPPKREQADR